MFWPGFFKIFWPAVKLDKYFPHYFTIFCHIWWFFKVQQCLVRTPLWKIIKYGKSLEGNEEKPWRFQSPKTRFSNTRSITLMQKLFLMPLLLLYWRQNAVAIIIRTSNCQILHLTEKRPAKLWRNYGILQLLSRTCYYDILIEKNFFLVGSDNSKVKTVFFICDIIHLLYLLFFIFFYSTYHRKLA